ncbi:MAG TPA: prolipoprotein diacylglyceryl transferase [Caulobacteraceae bacterium]|jgi:phosphatidylglycerol:prolipoprotein diacylglycerol transferase|nr:prolipoprotein diacylglyceryl transferase [Caulobacteraceae bacterium]
MALPYPDIPPAIFTIPAVHLGRHAIGPWPLRWYALAYIAGIILGWRYAVGLARNNRIWGGAAPATPLQVDDLVLWITAGIILGGRIGYILFYVLPLAAGRADLAADPLEALKLWHGGMSFHGGAIGVSLALIWFASRQRIPLLRLADLAAPAVPFGLFFGRIANFINGELWGRVTTAPWAMVFCSPHLALGPDGACLAGPLPRHPSQLYEAALEGVVLFLILRAATHAFGWLRRPGAVTGLFLLCYGAFRIALERVRMPDAGLQHLPMGLTVGTLLSVPMVLAGGFLIWRALHRPPIGPLAAEPLAAEPAPASTTLPGDAAD